MGGLRTGAAHRTDVYSCTAGVDLPAGAFHSGIFQALRSSLAPWSLEYILVSGYEVGADSQSAQSRDRDSGAARRQGAKEEEKCNSPRARKEIKWPGRGNIRFKLTAG